MVHPLGEKHSRTRHTIHLWKEGTVVKDSIHFMPSTFRERNRHKNASRLFRFFCGPWPLCGHLHESLP